ncbi:uncharacterized protein LOC134721647 [Mytilus trossulus]|uniref:uncharacterized protein LOC134721647 n=1 Tax=Mytilus trossulus TaxID=6551 RepID=UPI0030062D92
MNSDQENSKPSVFDRLSEDISKHNEKSTLQRISNASGISVQNTKFTGRPQKQCQALQWSKSKLGQTILYGKTTHQRHLETKIANIERQKLQSIRNMEWKQLDVFRSLANSKLNDVREKENISAAFQSSIDRRKRQFMAEQTRSGVVNFPSLSSSHSLVSSSGNFTNVQNENQKKHLGDL